MPTETINSRLQQIRAIAEAAARHGGLPSAVAEALDQIRALASGPSGDTDEPSDIPQTDNQSL